MYCYNLEKFAQKSSFTVLLKSKYSVTIKGKTVGGKKSKRILLVRQNKSILTDSNRFYYTNFKIVQSINRLQHVYEKCQCHQKASKTLNRSMLR